MIHTTYVKRIVPSNKGNYFLYPCSSIKSSGSSPSPSATQELAPARRWVLAAPTHPQPTGGPQSSPRRQNPASAPTQSRRTLVARAADAAVPATKFSRSGADGTPEAKAASGGTATAEEQGVSTGLLERAQPSGIRATLASGSQRPDPGLSQSTAETTPAADSRHRPVELPPTPTHGDQD